MGLMRSSGLVSEALGRLIAHELVTFVLGVHSVTREHGEMLVVSVSSDSSTKTRQEIHRVLDGPASRMCRRRPPATRDGGRIGRFQRWQPVAHWHPGQVSWIRDHTPGGLAITSAIPPVFESYATVVIPEDDFDRRASDAALIRLLVGQSETLPWWLGYLETGVHDVIFDDAPRVTLYAGWRYVLVEAGPLQATTWREDAPWKGRLPDLIYPADRSWLVSTLWDDDWRSIGGTAELIQAMLAEPSLDARIVAPEGNATPPGHRAR